MKKLIFVISLIITLVISYSFSNAEKTNLISNEASIGNYDCKYGQCYATAKSTGRRCKHCVSKEGDTYCWQHKKSR